MAKHNVRCNKADCRHRMSLAHALHWYIREPKCEMCKRPDTLRADPNVRAWNMKNICRCGGIDWPHMRKTMLGPYEFCEQLTLDDVSVLLVERGMMSQEEVDELNQPDTGEDYDQESHSNRHDRDEDRTPATRGDSRAAPE